MPENLYEKEGPLLSVVVPCYQIGEKASYLNECLKSLHLQTWKSIEVIIVNDGSPDDTQKVIEDAVENFRNEGMNVRSIEMKENLGVSEARNTGIRAARGRYVGFLDYDDLWVEHFAQNALEILEGDPTNKVVLGGTILYRRYGKKEKAHLLRIPDDINSMPWGEFCAYHLINNFRVGMGSAVICRRALFEEFPELRMDRFLNN